MCQYVRIYFDFKEIFFCDYFIKIMLSSTMFSSRDAFRHLKNLHKNNATKHLRNKVNAVIGEDKALLLISISFILAMYKYL